MASVLCALLPPDERHGVGARAALAILAEACVNLRSCGALARGLMRPEK